MRRYLFSTLFAFALTSAPASAVVVRTGDHETFTRVVVALPPDVTWEVRRDGDVIVVDLPDLRSDLDISSVFERIGRDRISDISTTDETLRVTLTCRCVVESFVTEPRLLVIDVLDGNANAIRSIESFVTTFPPEPSARRIDSSTEAGVTALVKDGLPDNDAVMTTTGPGMEKATVDPIIESSPEVFSGRAFLEDYGGAVQREQADNLDLVGGLGAALKQSLAQASDDGLLDATGNADGEAATSTAWQIRPVLADPTDVPSLRGQPDTQMTDVPSNCISDDEIDLTNWASGDDFLTELAAAQVGLLEPDGRTDPEAALSLAKVYLRFGLPSEAFDLLPDYDAIGQDYWLTKAVAEIMSDRQGKAANQLAGLLPCASDISFWAFLADPANTDIAALDGQALLRGFLRLPREVQTILAPPFQNKLRLAGLTDLAEETRLASLSLPERFGLPDLDGVAVALNVGTGNLQEGAGSTQSDNTPILEAIADVSAAWAEEGNLEPGLVELIASYASEHRSTAISSRLNLTLLRAHLLSDSFDDAFSVLSQLDFGDLRQQADESFVRLMEQRLTGFDLAKFRHLMRQRGGLSERDDEGGAIELFSQAFGRRPTSEQLSEPARRANKPLSGEIMAESRALGDAPSLVRGEEILRDSASLRDDIQDTFFGN